MGNAASAPDRDGQKRLSKPRTNTNSAGSSPLSERTVDVDSPGTNFDEMANDSVIWSPTGDCRSKQSVRQQLRETLCDTRPGKDQEELEDADDSLGELATHVRDRLTSLSRSGSLASLIPSARSSTTKLSTLQLALRGAGAGIEIQDAIAILHELSKSASPEDLLALRQALEPNSIPEPPVMIPTNRSEQLANRSSTTLIRRRSLATPAIATRSSTELKRRPLPNPNVITYKDGKVWKLEEFTASPLAKILSLEKKQAEPQDQHPRAETPADMDHIGALKLGSLRITNGAASPAPSVLSRPLAHKYSPDAHNDEDYFTASEGRASADGLRTPTKQISNPPSGMRSQRSGSPLKTERFAEDLVGDDLQHMSEPYAESTRQPRPVVRTQSAQHFANDYMAEISSSPFVEENRSDSDSPRSYERSDIEDSFENSPENSKFYREEALRLLDGTMFSSNFHSQRPQYSGVMKTQLYERENTRPPNTKADSGYSSNHSVHTVQDDLSQVESRGDYFQPQQPSEIASAPGVAISPLSFEQLTSPSVEAPGDATGKLDSKKYVSSPLLRKSKSWHRSVLGISSPTSEVSSKDFDKDLEPKPASVGKKLQKKRPQSLQPPIITSVQPIADGSIPRVPSRLANTFVRRLSEAPGMDHLEHTFASVSTTELALEDSNPTSERIEVEFPYFDSPVQKPKQRRSQASRPPTPPPHRHPPKLSDNRRNSYQRHSKNLEDSMDATITDFGTVAESLGASPYDIATSLNRSRPQGTRTHPHQMGTPVLRAKSMVNMTDEVASEFARLRSVDRNPPSRRGRSRPRSEYDPQLDMKPIAMAHRSRPQSMYEDIPPVPQLPANRDSLGSATVTPTRTFEVEKPQRTDSHHSPSSESKTEDDSWEQTQKSWSSRRQAISNSMQRLEEPESLAATQRPPAKRSKSRSRYYAHTQSELSIQTTKPRGEVGICDRYGGGLHYQYEAGYGLGGSAGTRNLKSAASRKSLSVAYTYGVDLTDIPVFVTETR